MWSDLKWKIQIKINHFRDWKAVAFHIDEICSLMQ